MGSAALSSTYNVACKNIGKDKISAYFMVG